MAPVLALVLACLVALAGCGDEPPSSSGGKAGGTMPQAGPAWTLRANYVDAGPQGPAVLTLWLVPGNPGASPPPPPGQGWGKALAIVPQGGQTAGEGVRLALEPAPALPLRLVYELTPPARPAPGTRFTARLEVEGKPLTAGPFIAQATPEDQLRALRLRARAARLMGQGEEMEATGRELARLIPASPAGPYYQGLGRETAGDLPGALKAFEQALALIQAKKPRPEDEPPVSLLRRVHALRRALAKKP